MHRMYSEYPDHELTDRSIAAHLRLREAPEEDEEEDEDDKEDDDDEDDDDGYSE